MDLLYTLKFMSRFTSTYLSCYLDFLHLGTIRFMGYLFKHVSLCPLPLTTSSHDQLIILLKLLFTISSLTPYRSLFHSSIYFLALHLLFHCHYLWWCIAEYHSLSRPVYSLGTFTHLKHVVEKLGFIHKLALRAGCRDSVVCVALLA